MCALSFFYSAVIFVVLISVSQQQQTPLSPCPKIFHYENDGVQFYGIIEVPSPPLGSSMVLDIIMSIATELPTQYVGRIELLGERGDLVQQILNRLPVKYKIHFPLLTVIPRITKIEFNKNRICSGPPATGAFVTSITLQHRLRTEGAGGNGNNRVPTTPKPIRNEDNFVFLPENLQPVYSGFDDDINIRPTEIENVFLAENNRPNPDNFAIPVRPTRPPIISTTRRPTSYNNRVNSVQCGISKQTSNALIVNGDATEKGDWPWLVAMYTKKINGLDFICAGTLVSDRHVVTAAHCVRQNNNRATKVEELLIKVGVFNLQDWGDANTKSVNVQDIKLHPSFDGGLVLKADIAILVIDVIAFSDYIIPICLWNESDDQTLIVGQPATVVGWGRDENGLISTPEPRKAIVPIVSTDTCRGSRPEFFYLTSNMTLCAGAKNGIGPCNGDSGGGLFLWRNSRWTLRGVVSNSLKDPNSYNTCNLNEYVVFTDSAKYIDWIRETIGSN